MSQPANAVGLLHITFHKGSDLRDTEVTGKQDPYVKFWVAPGEKQKQKTSVHKKGGTEPVWEEKFALQIEGKDASIDVQVYNKELIVDETIGKGSFPIEKLLESDKPMWYTLDSGYGFLLITARFKGTYKNEPFNTIDAAPAAAAAAAPAAAAAAAPAAVALPAPVVVTAAAPPPAPVSVASLQYVAPPIPQAVQQKPYVPELQVSAAIPAVNLSKKGWAIHNLYRAVFHRKPDEAVVAHHVALLEGKRHTISTLFYGFLNSEEFYSLTGHSAESLPVRDFVGRAYEAMIGRTPVSSEYNKFLPSLSEGKMRRFDVAHQIGTFDEFNQRQEKGLHFKPYFPWFIRNLCKHAFGREADADLIKAYNGVLERHETNLADVVKGFLEGPEFKAKGHGDYATIPSADFVKLVWRVFLCREPVQAELDNYANADMAHAVNRYALIEKVQMWDEFSNQVNNLDV